MHKTTRARSPSRWGRQSGRPSGRSGTRPQTSLLHTCETRCSGCSSAWPGWWKENGDHKAQTSPAKQIAGVRDLAAVQRKPGRLRQPASSSEAPATVERPVVSHSCQGQKCPSCDQAVPWARQLDGNIAQFHTGCQILHLGAIMDSIPAHCLLHSCTLPAAISRQRLPVRSNAVQHSSPFNQQLLLPGITDGTSQASWPHKWLPP